MDTNEWQLQDQSGNNKQSQINVTLSVPQESSDEVEIDLIRLFNNMKQSRRIYAWLIILCIVAGLCAPLLLYQFTKPMQTVSSVVTLDYQVGNEAVQNLTAPDGTSLDLTQILSSYVLSNALYGMKLSAPITISNLRANIKIERVLTDSSRRTQEIAAQMKEENNTQAFAQAQNVTLTYQNKFIVSLSNGFGNDESVTKLMLTNSELSVLLNRIISAYNDYLAETYADFSLPADEFTLIDPERQDIQDCLDLLASAESNLYAYCSSKPRSTRYYRSWKTGYTLADLMQDLQTCREVDINYLYSYIFQYGITKDKNSLILKYQYRLRNTELRKETLNKNIETIDSILKNYKNDEIVVAKQENDSSQITSTPTDYFNHLVMEQSGLYKDLASVQNRIDDLNNKIAKLTESNDNSLLALDSQESIQEELYKAISNCRQIYNQIKAHMEELQDSSQYKSYINSTEASGAEENFLKVNLKKMLIGGLAGGIVGIGLWFMAALTNEFKYHNDKNSKKEVAA